MTSVAIQRAARARELAPWALATIGAALYLLLDPPSVDLAAQEYRAQLFRDAGPTLWDNGWYGGHLTPAYSVLFPPLGAALGVRIAAALVVVAATALFARLVRTHWGSRAHLAALWFAIAVLASVVSGRITFTLGVAVGLGALLALASQRLVLAGLLAAATALASPVAALFLALAVSAWGLASPRERGPRAAAIALGALGITVALSVLFGEGGSEPFAPSSFWPSLIAVMLLAALLPARERALRIGAVLYALALLATFAVASPLGGNVTRLGALVAGPVVVAALTGRRRRAIIIVIALPLAYWSLYPAVRDVARSSADPANRASYYTPLLHFLKGRGGTFRVEIPFTQSHWETTHVARTVPLARGWERQLDRRYDALFYDGALDDARYRAWLNELAVRYVALPDVALDESARGEARLIEAGRSYLRPVWRSRHWRVFAVRDATPLVAGAASQITLTRDGFRITAGRAGVALVRVRHTRWWAVTSGHACVEPAGEGMTRVRVRRAGTIAVQARLGGPACRA